MRVSHTGILVVAALCAGLMSQAVSSAAADPSPKSRDPSSAPDEIIVRAKALEKLRFEIRRAEEAVYSRFNEINSTDLYDIHCYERRRFLSHINHVVCLSNAWRKFDAAIAESTVQAMQGGSTGGISGGPSGGLTGFAQASRANQEATEQRIKKEMGELAHSDPALRAEVMRLGQAYKAEELMTGLQPFRTLDREVPAGDKGLPFNAQRLFEVRVGEVAWSHALNARTFTLASVNGHIRDLRLDCGKIKRTLEYKEDLDWTIPDAWGECTLSVRAKRETTFALYEFE